MLNSGSGLLEPGSSAAAAGGWAWVKKIDPESGIGRRGFVPVNCLMDVAGAAVRAPA